MLPRLLALLSLILIASTIQARDFPGYYITRNSDTVKCNFQFKDWEVTPAFITISNTGAVSSFYPADISGFGVYGYGDYTSGDITYHKGNYTALEAPDTFSDSVIRKSSFLKLLVKGQYTLYELVESSRSYYFYQTDNGPINELTYRVKRIGMNLEKDEAYKKTIFDLFASHALSYQYSNKITKSVYSSRDIAPLFRTLNEKVSGQTYVRKKKKLIGLDLFIGGIRHQFPTTVDGMYSARLNTFDDAQSFTGGFNFQYFVPSNFKSIAVGASLAYSKYSSVTDKTDSSKFFGSVNNYRNTNYHEDFKIDNTVLMFDIYTQYIFNPLNRVNIYAKAGIVTNFMIGGPQKILVNYESSTTGVSTGVPVSYTANGVKEIELRKTYYNVHGGLGLIAGRHKLDFAYYTPGILNGAYGFKMKMMGVYYYYTIMKKG